MTGASLILPTALTGLSNKVRAEQMEVNRHGGPYWLTIHAGGGWDPTLLCDPKGITSADDPALPPPRGRPDRETPDQLSAV